MVLMHVEWNVCPLKNFRIKYCLAVLIAIPTTFLPKYQTPIMPLVLRLPSASLGSGSLNLRCLLLSSPFPKISQSRLLLSFQISAQNSTPLWPIFVISIILCPICLFPYSLHSLAWKVHKSRDFVCKHLICIFENMDLLLLINNLWT